MRNKSALKYITALILFGSNGIVASYITLSSYEIVFTRTLIGALFLALLFVFSGQERRFWKNKTHSLYLIISGVAMGASWMFLFEAYRQIGVSVATLAYYCGPVIVMIFSQIVFKEKITIAKGAGFFAVILGMFFLNQQAFLQGQPSRGLGFGILAAMMYAFMVIFNKKAVSITGLENPTWQLMASFVTVAFFLVFRQAFPIPVESKNLMLILLLGVVNTGVGCYFYFSSIGDLPVQTVAMLGYLEPLSALFFSAALLGESLDFLQLIGAVLILGGAAFGEWFHRKQSLEISKDSLGV
ncbi:MAG: EamA family transporter [Anaerolineales bacterium]|nr:EamA family transporter [Anaerolineales bacterium]